VSQRDLRGVGRGWSPAAVKVVPGGQRLLVEMLGARDPWEWWIGEAGPHGRSAADWMRGPSRRGVQVGGGAGFEG
jgi:hypothetical protein